SGKTRVNHQDPERLAIDVRAATGDAGGRAGRSGHGATSEEAGGRKWRERNLGLLAAQELGDETAGPGGADQADMAVAESIDDVARDARVTDAGTSVRHAGPMTEPGLDARGRNVLRQLCEHAEEVIAQDLGALPVRRG